MEEINPQKLTSPPLSVKDGDEIKDLNKSFATKATLSEKYDDEEEEGYEDALEGSQSASVSDSAVSDFEDSELGTTMPPAPSFKSVLLQFLKTIATSGTDLYSMSSPAIMCNGISVLEYCAHYCDHPEILASIPKGECALDRMLVVVQWFLSGLFGSYASRSTSSGFERKPFNPILGERFFAEWKDEGYGHTEMIAEQVSHHPPTTAFYLKNKTAGVHVSAFSTQKTKFLGTSIKAEQQGNVFVYLDKHNEEYMISLPEIYVRGILTGAPFVELCGDVAIVSSSGYGVKMRFIPKPWFSGEYDQVEAVIFDTKSGKIHFDIWGKWSGAIYFSEHEEDSPKRCHFRKRRTGGTSPISGPTSDPSSSYSYGTSGTGEPYTTLVEDHSRQGPILFNPEMMPKVPFEVKPISQQSELESRRVWHPVTKALRRADYDTANAAKNDIENHQRALRRKRAEAKETWKPTFFNYYEFCFMPNVHKSSTLDLEDALSKLVAESPKMLVTKVESEKEDEEENGNESQSSSSSRKKKSSCGYKGRWIFKDFHDKHVKY